MTKLAIDGGTSVRDSMLPYGRQWVDDSDIDAVIAVLKGDWLTTGPMVEEFETAFANAVGAEDAVAVSSGTAALHCAMHALGIGSGDEVIVPAMTFAATANCVLYQGASPVFVDVDPDTLLIDTNDIKNKITRHTAAIIAVDYAGQPCDYDALSKIARDYGLAIVADACHSLGGSYKNRPVGSLADLSVFSFHPVKHITTGEGGVVTSDNSYFMDRIRSFRNQGIAFTHSQRTSWFYEMTDLGYNYRLTDIQCALGISQLRKLDSWIARRREIASTYDHELQDIDGISPLRLSGLAKHAYHLYVVQLDLDRLIWIKQLGRAKVYKALGAEGIGVNVHYIPVYLHPYYRERLGTGVGLAPVAEAAYERILSLPIFPAMTDEDVDDVICALWKVMREYVA